MGKKQVPAIRFQGFTDAWEQRKLGELIREISTGKSVNSDEGIVRADNIGVLKTSCVSYDRFDPSESKPVVKDEWHLVKCAVEKDSVIVSRMNTPERVGACGYIERSFPNLFLPDRLWKLRFQENVNTYFLYTMLISGGYKEKITSMASGTSGSMYNIPKDAFLNLRLTLSLDIDEQKKIGDYFKQLDHLITLHQRKYEKLLKVKKSMLEKMFPRDGADVPEIRFDGFTDAWEQRKLGELISEHKETVDSSCTLPVLTSAKTEGVILQEEHFGRKQQHDITGYNVLPRSYCTYRNRSDGVDFTFNVNECCDMGIISKFYPVFCGKDNDTYFLSLVLNNSGEVVHEIAYTCTGTGQKVLSFLDLQKMSIRVPRHDEQKKISAYFKQLDHLITLHQRKLEKLKNIKKSMLEKMFV